MIRADVALFAALGHYWSGMSRILSAELEYNEGAGLKDAAGECQKAVEQIRIVRQYEERILKNAQTIEYSAYFVRRHEVLGHDTETLLHGLEELTRDLVDGYYPASACVVINGALTKMMAHFEQDARVEGVLHRFEMRESDSAAQK